MTNPHDRRALGLPALCLFLFAPAAFLLAQDYGENFDGVTPPNLPAGWTTLNPETRWVTSAAGIDTLPNAAVVDDANHVTDKRLDSPSFAVPVGGALLSFTQTYDIENGFDGGVLEISIDGGGFQDIIAAGGSFFQGGYTGPIVGNGNPLTGRQAWTGNSGASGPVLTEVQLPPNAAGHNAQLRWRMGTDGSNVGSFAGWTIDTVSAPPNFAENFDGVTPPALPNGWVANSGDWVNDNAFSDTPPNAPHIAPVQYARDWRLISPAIAIASGATSTLTFHQSFFLDTQLGAPGHALDAANLEVSIAGGPFQDILSAGGAFTANGYNEDCNPACTDWGASSDGFLTTTATLPASADGKNIQLSWHLATDNTDNGFNNDGWRIDSVSIVSCPPTAVAIAAKPSICSNSSTTLTGSGGDLCSWAPATWLSDPLSCTPTVTPVGATGTVNYTLTVTKLNCPAGSQTDTAGVSVTSEATPVAVATATRASICPGGLTTLHGFGGDSCVWTPASGLSDPNSCTPSARPMTSTMYSLTVTNACGNSSNGASVTITVTARPDGPQISVPAAAAAGQTGLVASVINPNPGSTYAWLFAPVGAATITAQGPSSITFTANFEGPLTLSVTENDGICVSLATMAIIPVGPACVDPQPPTDLKIQVSGNPDLPVTGIDFLDLSWIAPQNLPLFYLWSINGNPEQETTNTSVLGQPPTGSNNPITLQVRSACSEELASDPAEVTVSPSPPVASFQIDSTNVGVGTPVVFTDTSVPAATSWLWLFGDGSDPETTQSVTHPFAEGTFTVFLIASNGAGSSAASQEIEVPQTVFPSTERVLATHVFDASRKNRQRLDALSFSGAGPRWLHVKSQETAHEAIAFLRFLDAAGKVVLERRLSISPGQDAVFDLNAYGLRGVYDLEVVSLRSVTASLVANPSRQTREVRRPER